MKKVIFAVILSFMLTNISIASDFSNRLKSVAISSYNIGYTTQSKALCRQVRSVVFETLSERLEDYETIGTMAKYFYLVCLIGRKDAQDGNYSLPEILKRENDILRGQK